MESSSAGALRRPPAATWRGTVVAWTEPEVLRIAPALLAAAMVAGALASVLLPSTLSYDPWSWVVWGRELLAGDLDTVGGPSWKPLPVLFTAPFSVFGGAAPHLWEAVAWAGTCAAIVFAGALGARLAGRLGAVLTVVVLLLAPWLWRAVGLGNSEGLALLGVVGLLERHLAGRHGQAFAFGVLAGLLRPEAWVLVGLYALLLLVQDRRRLPWLGGGLLLLPVLWLVPEQIGSGDFLRAAGRAQEVGADSPGAAERPALAVVELALRETPRYVALAFALAAVCVLWVGVPHAARRVAALVVAVGAGWVVVVAAMAEAGFSGIWRYLFVPVALANLVGAACVAWTVGGVARRRGERATLTAALAAAAVLCAALVTTTARELASVVRGLAYEEDVNEDLPVAIALAGGRSTLLSCGDASTGFYLLPAVAWALELHVRQVRPEPRPPGFVLRTRFPLGGDVVPPPGRLDGRTVARSEHWQVEARCTTPALAAQRR